MTTRERIKRLGGTDFRSEDTGPAGWVAGCTFNTFTIAKMGETRERAEARLVERMRELALGAQFGGAQ